MFTYRGAYLNALAMIVDTGLRSESVYLSIVPMFHCNGWCFPWAMAAVGGTHVLLRKVDPELVWDLFEPLGITHYSGTPTAQIALANHPRARRLEAAVTVTSGGSSPSPTLIARMHELNLRLVHVYGLTETYGPSTLTVAGRDWASLAVDEQARLMARQGQANILADLVLVVDEQMRDVPQDGQTMGGGGDARQHRDEGLLWAARGHRRCLPRRLVPLR